jgi:hypothetical protein
MPHLRPAMQTFIRPDSNKIYPSDAGTEKVELGYIIR